MSIVQEAARQAVANRQMRSSPSPIKLLVSAQRGLTLIFNEIDSIKTPVLQSVFYIMAGVETCFLKLSEELNGRNQVQKM